MADERTKELQQRRMREAQKRDFLQKRAKNSPAILSTLHSYLGERFTLEPVDSTEALPTSAKLAKKIEQSPGLVSAYVSLEKARQLLHCCATAIGEKIDAKIWFDEKCYMGLISCKDVHLPMLADLAVALADRIHVFPVETDGRIVVDFYHQPWLKEDRDFSVVFQGADLEARVQRCFSTC